MPSIRGELIDRMEAPDTDIRFMALNDLVMSLQKGILQQNEISSDLISAVLKLLKDNHTEVRNKAVNAACELFSKAHIKLSVAIIERFLKGMEEGHDSVSYGVGLKGLVNSTPVDKPEAVQALASYLIEPLINMVKNDDKSTQIEACEILADMMSKFADELATQQRDILSCMFGAMNSPQPHLRKRAAQMVTKFINYEDIHSAVLAFVRERIGRIMGSSESTDDQIPLSISYVKITLTCLTGLTHSAESLAAQASDILTDFLLGFLLDTNIMETLLPRLKKEFGDPEPEDAANEFKEMSLHCLENLIQARQRTAFQCSYLSRFLESHLHKIIEKLSELVDYDPLRLETKMEVSDDGSDDGFDMLEENDVDDDDYDDDTDDSSWKVRRAAVRVVDSIVRGYPEKLQRLYFVLSDRLIARLPQETCEMTIMDIFTCLGSFIKATTLKNVNTLKLRLEEERSPQKSLTRLLPLLFNNLTPFLLPSTIKRDRCQNVLLKMIPNLHPPAITLINRLASALPGYLGNHLEVIFKMVKHDFSESGNTNAWKIELLKLLVLIINTHEYETYAPYADLLNSITLKAISDTFYRVRSEGLEFVQVLVQRCPLDKNVNLTPLFSAIRDQLMDHRNDLELKIKVMNTMATYIEHVGQDIAAESILQCLKVFEDCLDDQNLAIPALRGLTLVYGSPTSVKECLVSRDVLKKLVSMTTVPNNDMLTAALRCITKVCNSFPRDFILNGDNNVSILLPQLPLWLNSSFTPVVQETLELASALLKNCCQTDVVQQNLVADFYTRNDFLTPIVIFANTNITQPSLLTALVHLAQSIGMYKPDGHILSIPFMLEKLTEKIEVLTSVEADKAFFAVKDTIPTLSRISAELILQLPRYGQLNSVDSTLEAMCRGLKQKTFTFVKRYLYVLIFGDVGYRIDISHRGDVFDVLMDHVALKDCVLPDAYLSKLAEATSQQPKSQTPMEVQGETLTHSDQLETPTRSSAATISDGGFSQLRMLAAESVGRMISGEPAAMVHELLQFFKPDYIAEGCTYQNQIHFYLFQTLKQTIVNLVEVRNTEHLFKRINEIWSIIVSEAGHKEEGTRNIVAECLGRVAFLQPDELVPRLHQEMKSPEVMSSPTVLCTYVTAFKFLLSTAASINYPDDPTENRATISDVPVSLNSSNIYLSLLTLKERYEFVNLLLKDSRFLDIMGFVTHEEPDVCRVALITLNTAAHYWPPLIRTILKEKQIISGDSRTLLDALYQATKVRPELIKTVQIGPFKVDFDNGIDLRKTAFECMSTLLEDYVEYLPISPFLDTLISGLKDHNYVKISCCHILRRAVQFAPIDIVEKMPELVQSLVSILHLQAKQDLVKQEAEKLEEVKSCVLYLIYEFSKIPDFKKSQMHMELMKVIHANAQLHAIWSRISLSSSSPAGTS